MVAAIRHSRKRVVTAAMDRMNFMYPIYIGELVTLHAMVTAAWRTSIEVGVRVEAENPHTGEIRDINAAYLTMVALDDDGEPSAVPPIVAESPDEQRSRERGGLRRKNRLAERAAIHAHREQLGPSTRPGGAA